MKKYIETNKVYWNEVANLHFDSNTYDLQSFRDGASTLSPIDIAALGDIDRKSLLHLHCHFGLDTISWCRRGALATGVDFSPKAIDIARALAHEIGSPAEFVCCDAADVHSLFAEPFDIVWAVEGVVAWIPDIYTWFRSVASVLRPGGTFYLRDFHPVAEVMDFNAIQPQLNTDRSYFEARRQVTTDEEPGTHADRNLLLKQPYHFEWQHPLAEIMSAMLECGLIITEFKEYPFSTYKSHAFLVKGKDGKWRFPEGGSCIPLMFSVEAVKGVSGAECMRGLDER